MTVHDMRAEEKILLLEIAELTTRLRDVVDSRNSDGFRDKLISIATSIRFKTAQLLGLIEISHRGS